MGLTLSKSLRRHNYSLTLVPTIMPLLFRFRAYKAESGGEILLMWDTKTKRLPRTSHQWVKSEVELEVNSTHNKRKPTNGTLLLLFRAYKAENGDLILRKMGAARDPTQGKLGPNWEGSYQITS